MPLRTSAVRPRTIDGEGTEASQPGPRSFGCFTTEPSLYVRAGMIVPMAPLVQSTDETPQGPLTLRIYVPAKGSGAACGGELDQDDGHSFAFRQGAYLRIKMSCSLAADGALTVRFYAPEGSFKPWFSEVRLEVYGFDGRGHSSTAGKMTAVRDGVWSVTIPRPLKAEEVVLR